MSRRDRPLEHSFRNWNSKTSKRQVVPKSSSSPASTGDCQTVKRMSGGMERPLIRCCVSEGTNETFTVLGKARRLLTRKSQLLAREQCYLHTRWVASGYATAESSASHRTLAGSERYKYGSLYSQVGGHCAFRQNFHKNFEVNLAIIAEMSRSWTQLLESRRKPASLEPIADCVFHFHAETSQEK